MYLESHWLQIFLLSTKLYLVDSYPHFMHIRYITKLLPSIVRYTAYLGTKSHIPFLFTLKYFTQNTIQLKMSSLPSCTCYPQILHHTFCPITPIVVAYFRWSFQNLLPSDTTPDMQEKNSIFWYPQNCIQKQPLSNVHTWLFGLKLSLLATTFLQTFLEFGYYIKSYFLIFF